MSGLTICPVGSCSSPVRHGQLMCLYHWRATPRTMQMDVNRAWRNFSRRSEKADPIALLTTYRAARDAAIAHHDSKEAARA